MDIFCPADVDFDSAPVNAFFSGHQNRTCVNVRIINDFSAGESREEFAVGLSNPEISMEVIIGQPSRAAVVINSRYDCHYMPLYCIYIFSTITPWKFQT